jgi:hypothetical protein
MKVTDPGARAHAVRILVEQMDRPLTASGSEGLASLALSQLPGVNLRSVLDQRRVDHRVGPARRIGPGGPQQAADHVLRGDRVGGGAPAVLGVLPDDEELLTLSAR